MAQPLQQQTPKQFFGGTTATLAFTLTGVPAGAHIQVVGFCWGSDIYPELTAAIGTTNFSAVYARSGVSGGLIAASCLYLENVAGGDYTVNVTHPATSGNRYGWVRVQVFTNRKASGSLMAACTAKFETGSSTTSTPGVVAAAATSAPGLAVAVLEANTAGTDAGIDPATGTPSSWNNALLEQDANAEAAGSADYIAVGAGVTPDIGWGTLTAAARCAALLVVFEDAEVPLSGSATAGASASADLTATGSRTFSMTLYEVDGVTPAASKTGLWWSWWDTIGHVRTAAANASGTGASTDASGLFSVAAPSGLSVGTDQGFGVISSQDATADGAELAYVGSFDVL